MVIESLADWVWLIPKPRSLRATTRDFLRKCLRQHPVYRAVPPPDRPLAIVDWFGDG